MRKNYSLKTFFFAFTFAVFAVAAQAQCFVSCGTGSDGAFSASSNTTLPGGVYNYTSFSISSGATVTVTGSVPLIIYCTGNVQIDGTLDLDGGNGTDGVTFVSAGTQGTGVAGGGNGGNGIFSVNQGPLNGSNGNNTGGGGMGASWSGGGGAGYAVNGQSASSSTTDGVGGMAYGNVQISAIMGGSGGAGGSGGFNCGSGGGGGGGGYVSIAACGTITVSASGSIRANGGNGGSDGTGSCGGGGGGSGGSIRLLTSSTLTTDGMITALGGLGGASWVAGPPYYGTGGNGSEGRIFFMYTGTGGSGTVNPSPVGFLLFSATATAHNVSCFGGNDGGATAVPLGGVSPFTYSWSPVSSTNATLNNVPPGTYSVIVTDNNGCADTAAVTVAQPAQLAVVVSAQTDTRCFNSCDGSATVSASGGNGAYTYAWSPSVSCNADSCNQLCAGNHSVLVTDSLGCTASVLFTTSEPALLHPGSTNHTDASTSTSNDGTASMTGAGGTPPYSYLWTPGNLTGSSVSGLAPGNYICVITDANGCTAGGTVVIGVMNGVSTISDPSFAVNLYPNPAQDEIHLSVTLVQKADVVLEIYNLVGEKTDAVTFPGVSSMNEAYATSKLPNGVYFFRVSSGGMTVTKRVIVSH